MSILPNIYKHCIYKAESRDALYISLYTIFLIDLQVLF